MRPSLLLSLLTASCSVCAKSLRPRDYNTHDYYAVELHSSVSPDEFAAHLGLEHEGQIGALTDHHLFRKLKDDSDVVEGAVQELKRRRRKRDAAWEPSVLDGVRFRQKQKVKPRHWKRGVPKTRPAHQIWNPFKRAPQAKEPEAEQIARQQELMETLEIQDPVFKEQWHLFNPVEVGNDLNVTEIWKQGITGHNVTVCIVDDGLDMDSDDLHDNYYAAGSYDFNDHVDEPKPRLSDDRHGTRCAGEVSAVKNDVCGVGVAWDSHISGIRILSGGITDSDEALALNYDMDNNHIYSCSWGPPDDGQSMEAPGILIKKAMVKAVQDGRSGKGNIFVFAAGNGAAADDNCNFDGYTNSIYSITVGAIDKKNQHPYYSEKCSAQLVVTYSSGAGDAIHTTDVGKDVCSSTHGGTSAAGPLAAGVYALVLQERPDLNWRDLQWLTVLTADKFDTESDWTTTALGREYSHQYGYGRLDAYAIVEAAKNWTSVKPQAWYWSPWIQPQHKIPQGTKGLASAWEVTADHLKEANLERIEHVTVTMNIKHQCRGDLSVELRSPSGMVSHIATTRKNDASTEGYADWTFMSVAHWGETGIGNWTVIVKDTKVNKYSGTFEDWRLRLWGESIDGSQQALIDLPTEHDDDDHDAPATAVSPHTTSITVPTETAEVTGNPTDHIDRPTKPKPTTTTTTEAPTSTIPTDIASKSRSPVASTASTATTTATLTASALPDSNFLPSPFPTFGVSKRTQIWIYGSAALILLFCGSLATYFWLARRRRAANRDDYEFAVLNEDDDDGNNASSGLMGRKKGRSRRAGELYDAFAGESEEELFSDESEDEHDDGLEGYRDYREKYESEGGVEGERMGGGRGSAEFNEKHSIGEDSGDESAGERDALGISRR